MAAQHPQAPSSAARPSTFASMPMTTTNAPPGTFAAGTKVQVGSHRVIIERYLSEGGFAHVYVVRVPLSNGKAESAVLKRVAVPDKEALANMRTEVETMKKLKGHKHIVTYIDSHASQLKGGGYEVFLLMEYCQGGGLIDFMNTRLKDRLTEPEILKIFSDATEGVACMHYLKPPLLHRDLKVENILIGNSGSSKVYKLCDFGSSAPPRPAATTAQEGRLIEEDVQKHTTLQYRSPEMIDVYRKQPIDEKSDIWALGVLLYKLCYYTTPFESQGQMAILNASFKYPAYPPFSDKLKFLIARMLSEQPQKRPNVYQVLKDVCSMRGVACPISDIYSQRSHSEVRRNQQLPPREPDVQSPPMVGASYAPPEQLKQNIPEVTPMRRGRPGTTSLAPSTEKPSASRSPGRPVSSVDPFAALDSTNYATRAAAADELAARYPSLDDFSLLQDKGASQFNFQKPSPKDATGQSLHQRLTNRLADEAFASSRPSPSNAQAEPRSSSLPKATQPLPPRKTTTADHPVKATYQSPPIKQPQPQKPAMVSTGTMTSRPSSPATVDNKQPIINERPIWRVPATESTKHAFPARGDSLSSSKQPVVPEIQRPSSRSHRDVLRESSVPKSPSSSRPSLEMLRPSNHDIPETLHRSKSTEDRRHVTRTPDPPLSHSHSVRSSKTHGLHLPHPHFHHSDRPSSTIIAKSQALEHHGSDEAIESNVDFLRAMEEENELARGHHRRASSTLKHLKHASLPSAISGTKSRISGRLGDTFRRFEDNKQAPRPNAPDSLLGNKTDTLTPIEGSQRAESPGPDDHVLEDSELLSPEARRELERRRLSQEERRVAEAGMAYRQNMESGPEGGRRPPQTRANAIQDRVRNLLDESGRTSPVKRTASGYGRYTEPPTPPGFPDREDARKPPPTAMAMRPAPTSSNLGTYAAPVPSQSHVATLPTRSATEKISMKPTAPPKPVKLRTGGPTPQSQGHVNPGPDMAGFGEEDFDSPTSFSKRYPSLSLEMVETEIAKAEKPPQRPMRVKDV